MATIRGYKKGINETALREAIDKYTTRVVQAAIRAGKEAMKNLREGAVREWYGTHLALPMNRSTSYDAKVKQSDKDILITISSYVDVDKYEDLRNLSKIYEWRERHEVGNRGSDGTKGGSGYWTYYDKAPSEKNPLRPAISMKETVGEYLFNLPWEEGITGLPPFSTLGTGWVNPVMDKHMREGDLKTFVEEKLKTNWAEEVNKNLKI